MNGSLGTRASGAVLYEEIIFVTKRPPSIVGQSLVLPFLRTSYAIICIIVAASYAAWRIHCRLRHSILPRSLRSELIGAEKGKENGSYKTCESFFLLLLTIMLGLFGNMLSIFLYRNNPSPPLFTTFPEYTELLVSGRCQLAIAKTFLNNVAVKPHPESIKLWRNSKPLKDLLQAFTSNPPIVFDLMWQAARYISQSERCLIGLTFKLNTFGLSRAICNLEFIPIPTLSLMPYTFLFSNNFTDHYLFNSIISSGDVQERYEYLMSHAASFYPHRKCLRQNSSPISLHQLEDAYGLLLIGLGLALVLALVEYVLTPLFVAITAWVLLKN